MHKDTPIHALIVIISVLGNNRIARSLQPPISYSIIIMCCSLFSECILNISSSSDVCVCHCMFMTLSGFSSCIFSVQSALQLPIIFQINFFSFIFLHRRKRIAIEMKPVLRIAFPSIEFHFVLNRDFSCALKKNLHSNIDTRCTANNVHNLLEDGLSGDESSASIKMA